LTLESRAVTATQPTAKVSKTIKAIGYNKANSFYEIGIFSNIEYITIALVVIRKVASYIRIIFNRLKTKNSAEAEFF